MIHNRIFRIALLLKFTKCFTEENHISFNTTTGCEIIVKKIGSNDKRNNRKYRCNYPRLPFRL